MNISSLLASSGSGEGQSLPSVTVLYGTFLDQTDALNAMEIHRKGHKSLFLQLDTQTSTFSSSHNPSTRCHVLRRFYFVFPGFLVCINKWDFLWRVEPSTQSTVGVPPGSCTLGKPVKSTRRFTWLWSLPLSLSHTHTNTHSNINTLGLYMSLCWEVSGQRRSRTTDRY